jgi:hypothetical protein
MHISVWTSKSSPRLKIFCLHFFGKQLVIHKEFVPEGQTASNAFYAEFIGRLLKHIPWVRPQFRAEGSWFLLH